MNRTPSTTVQRWTRLAAGCFAAALFGTSLAAAGAPQASQGQAKLVGTWLVQVTLRDCTTNSPLGAPINTLVTFNRGGTLTESNGSLGFAPNQRSAGHGTWTRLPGRRFAQEMIAFLLFDTPANLPGTPGFNPALPISPGFFAGWQTVSHTLRMVDDDHLESAGTNAFYKTDGSVYRAGCSTATARRFKAE
jgi:hypothetical protein